MWISRSPHPDSRAARQGLEERRGQPSAAPLFLALEPKQRAVAEVPSGAQAWPAAMIRGRCGRRGAIRSRLSVRLKRVSDSNELPSHRVSYVTAARALAETDPVIARLVAETGLPRLGRSKQSHFAALVQAVVYQQLAGRAAAAIHGRLIAALDGDIEPEPLLALSDETLRAVGLSANKAASVRDLAAKTLDGTVVLTPRGLARQDDEELIAALSAVRGIGRWTAQIFLMFQLRRIDVWPTGDFGVRRGYGLAWEVPMPTARQLEPLGDPYRPFRSVVAWYCWRAVELYAGGAPSVVTG